MEGLLYFIEIVGIISFSAAGAMIAIDEETDLFGVLILSLVTCFGGGLMRDVIVGEGLPALFSMHLELIICASTSLVIFIAAALFKREYVREEQTVNKINNVLDALGIGVFTATGTAMYISHGPLVSIVAGTFSAVGGGLLRDIILRNVPFILKKRVYAVAVIFGASLYYVFETYVLSSVENSGVISTVICLATVFVIRMCATRFKWNIPKAIIFSQIEDTQDSSKSQK
ncbi:MAG: trimeric intracellular cation channel family protein [Clostridia bacterium]|nr:trimeric intracellular cation channel family protein [Clostridia bacterium]